MTLSADSGTEIVGSGDIVVITQDVWASFLDSRLEPVPFHQQVAPGDPSMTGVVQVLDAWNGAIVVECSPRLAHHVAATMFRRDPATIGDHEVRDALGELTNMVGGNIKSLLPAPSRLSLPHVTASAWPTMIADGMLVSKVDFAAGPAGEPMHVSVWQR